MEELLTSDEVIAELKISRSTLNRLLVSGELQAWRLGEHGTLRFKRGDITSLLQPRGTESPLTREQLTVGEQRPRREQLTTQSAGRIGGFMKLT